MDSRRRLLAIASATLAAGAAAAGLLKFVEGVRCDAGDLAAALTLLALLLTLVPCVVALRIRSRWWWLGLACSCLLVLLLQVLFRPLSAYDCYFIS